MNITIEERKCQQAEARRLAAEIIVACEKAVIAQETAVQLVWDLGDILHKERDENPSTFTAWLAGAGVDDAMAEQAIRIRKLSETRNGVLVGNNMRQALFEVLVPDKVNVDGDRVELAPPQDWRKWVNASRVWVRKLEVGLQEMDVEAFVRETEAVWRVLCDAREKVAAKAGPHPPSGNPPLG
jgi:hypothetical protein